MSLKDFSNLTEEQIKNRKKYILNKEKLLIQMKERYKNKKEEIKEYRKSYDEKNRAALTKYQNNKRLRIQLEVIEYLGGQCNHCNFSFPACVYDFHHVEPKEKKFLISTNLLRNKKSLWEELDKCILLCSNCHRLEHSKALL